MADMMNVEEIEKACDASRPLDFSRHPLEGPELKFHASAYPYGFPVHLRSNSARVLDMYQDAWKAFSWRFDTPEINVDVTVVPSEGVECPPTPNFRIMLPLMVSVTDADNYTIIDLTRRTTTVVIAAIKNSGPRFSRTSAKPVTPNPLSDEREIYKPRKGMAESAVRNKPVSP